MTLETANRIVLEQGKDASKEAQAVVRGGMTICELTADGHRTYPWIKVKPTQTDEESSIEQALEARRAKKTTSNKKKEPIKESIEIATKAPEYVPVQIPEEDASLIEDKPSSFDLLISKTKRKLVELWKILDEIVVE